MSEEQKASHRGEHGAPDIGFFWEYASAVGTKTAYTLALLGENRRAAFDGLKVNAIALAFLVAVLRFQEQRVFALSALLLIASVICVGISATALCLATTSRSQSEHLWSSKKKADDEWASEFSTELRKGYLVKELGLIFAYAAFALLLGAIAYSLASTALVSSE